MSTTADRRHKSPSSSRSSIGPYVAPSSLLSQPISAGQAEMDTLSAELELTPATGSSSTASKAPQPSSKAPWQTLTAADLSQPWADMTDSSDDESPPLHSLHAPPSSSFRRDSVGLLSAHLGSTHLSLASVESPNLPGRTGLHRNSSVAQPVRTQIGFNLAHGDTGDVSSPGSVEGRPHPRSLRAVPSALSILNKEAPAVVQFEPHLEAVRQTGEDSAVCICISLIPRKPSMQPLSPRFPVLSIRYPICGDSSCADIYLSKDVCSHAPSPIHCTIATIAVRSLARRGNTGVSAYVCLQMSMCVSGCCRIIERCGLVGCHSNAHKLLH